MRRLVLSIGLIASLALGSPLREGTYIGYTHFEALQTDEARQLEHKIPKIPTVLEVLRRRGDARGRDELVASFKLSFGGYGSHEYLTQTYRMPDFDWTADAFALDRSAVSGNGPDLSLVAGRIGRDSGSIEGEVTSVRTSQRGRFHLLRYQGADTIARLDGLMRDRPYSAMLTGRYYGRCVLPGRPAREPAADILHLEVARVHSWERATTYPFAGHSITARLAGGRDRTRVQRIISEGVDYNPYSAVLRFPFLDRPCFLSAVEERSDDGAVLLRRSLDCGYCEFSGSDRVVPVPELRRIQALAQFHSERWSFRKAERTLAVDGIPRGNAAHAVRAIDPTQLTGLYRGYVHLEQRDRYQAVVIEAQRGGNDVQSGHPLFSLAAFVLNRSAFTVGVPDGGQVQLRGSPQSHRLTPFPFRNDGTALTVWGDGDIFLQITHWSDNVMAGSWFTKTSGRWGKFELQKCTRGDAFRPVDLPQPLQVKALRPLDGLYRGQFSGNTFPKQIDLQIDLSTNVGPQFPAFFPYAISGRLDGDMFSRAEYAAAERRGQRMLSATFAHYLAGGSFDPYSGVFRMAYGQGQIFGRLDSEANYFYFSGAGGDGAVLQRYQFLPLE